jgi:hypothetical protein
MDKRYDAILTSRVEEAVLRGWSLVQWWEAYLWYDQKKLGKNFYRDLAQRFSECVAEQEQKVVELQYIMNNEGILLLHGIQPISTKTGEE